VRATVGACSTKVGRPAYNLCILNLDALAERRILEAQEAGEFDNLPGEGAPLALDDDALVPEELRAAYRLLKNAGFVPPELEPYCEIRDVEQLLLKADDDTERTRLLSRINFLLTRASLGRRGSLRIEAAYAERIAERLAHLKSGATLRR
jgi:hypothetical protein